MKYVNFILIGLVSTSFASSFRQEKDWKLEGRLSGYFQRLDIENKKSDKEGYSHSQRLNVKYHGPLKDGNAGVEVRGRVTNDERIQKNNEELLYFRTYYKNKTWSYELGDVAASMNPYVFSGSLKGVKIGYLGGEKSRNWDYKFISGVRKKHWRDTYQYNEDEGADTYLAALSAKYIHERAKELKISLSTIKDHLDSRYETGKEGVSLGLDGKWRFNKYFTLKGRTAISKSTEDSKNEDKETATAIRLRLLTRPVLSSVKSNFMYERISPDFISAGGSSKNKDKERLSNSTTWRITKELNTKLDLKASRDNLDGQLTDTQHIYYEKLNFTYKPKAIKGLNVNLKLSNKDTKGRGVESNRYTVGLNGSLRQKNGFKYGTGYDYSHYDDENNNSASSIINNINVLLAYRKKLSKESSYRFTVRIDAQNVKKDSKSDNNLGFKIDGQYRFNKKLSTDLSYISRYSYREDSSDTVNSKYRSRTTYKLDERGKKILRLLLEKRDYDVKNNSSKGYDEYIGKLSYVYNF